MSTAGGRGALPVTVAINIDGDTFGFHEVMLVSVMNIAEHEVAVFGLCNLQVRGRRDGQWWRVWHVDCSRERRATTWIAPGDTVQFELTTEAWAGVSYPDFDAFHLRYLGAVSQPFRLDPGRR